VPIQTPSRRPCLPRSQMCIPENDSRSKTKIRMLTICSAPGSTVLFLPLVGGFAYFYVRQPNYHARNKAFTLISQPGRPPTVLSSFLHSDADCRGTLRVICMEEGVEGGDQPASQAPCRPPTTHGTSNGRGSGITTVVTRRSNQFRNMYSQPKILSPRYCM
jgi:hypothetical protein